MIALAELEGLGTLDREDSRKISLDQRFMRLALTMARNGTPFPNPHVGAVVVQAGRIVSVGHHSRVGSAHAEVVALLRAGREAIGADLYVTLEPCNHHGRTPPCVQSIVRAGISRVVIGIVDPNPNVQGGGASALEAAGIKVTYGSEPDEARELIQDWIETFTPDRLT